MTREEFLRAAMAAERIRRTQGGERPIIVGQAPPSNDSPHPLLPFPPGCAGWRLWKMSGWPIVAYLAGFDRVNTLQSYPGRCGKGDAFPLAAAREEAARLTQELGLRDRTVILVGRANASLYWPGELPEELAWHGRWAWMPHTSGIVQYWNHEPSRKRVAQLFCAVPKVGG